MYTDRMIFQKQVYILTSRSQVVVIIMVPS